MLHITIISVHNNAVRIQIVNKVEGDIYIMKGIGVTR